MLPWLLLAAGIPIYGPQSDNGLAPTDLDVCNGRTHPTLGYIYHTTNNTYPYTFGCYRYQTIRQRMISGTLVATGTGPGMSLHIRPLCLVANSRSRCSGLRGVIIVPRLLTLLHVFGSRVVMCLPCHANVPYNVQKGHLS